MLTRPHILISLLSTLAIVACGGGNADSTLGTSPDSRGVKAGVFLDSAVAGIAYRTASQSGLTDETGRFTFKDGEIVRFSIGNTVLGSAAVAEVLTPLNFVPNGTPATDPRVANVLVLLQSLDDDANPVNGIRVTRAVLTAFEAAPSIDLARAPLGLVSDAGLTRLLQAATAQNTVPRNEFVSVERAIRHFSSTTAQAWFAGEWQIIGSEFRGEAVVNSLGVMVGRSVHVASAWADFSGYVSPTGEVEGNITYADDDAAFAIGSAELKLRLTSQGTAQGRFIREDGRSSTVSAIRTNNPLKVPSPLERFVGPNELVFVAATDLCADGVNCSSPADLITFENCEALNGCLRGTVRLTLNQDGSVQATQTFTNQVPGFVITELTYLGHVFGDEGAALYLEPPALDERCKFISLSSVRQMTYSFVATPEMQRGDVAQGAWGLGATTIKGRVAADDQYCSRYSLPNALGPLASSKK